MLKTIYFKCSLVLVSLLVISCADSGLQEVEINEPQSACRGLCPADNGGGSSDPQGYDEGYEDGFTEGKQLAMMHNATNYASLWKSYRDYPSNFPNNQENFPYFQGKYIGIVEGWLSIDPPVTNADWTELEDNVCESGGVQHPCWLREIGDRHTY